MQLLLAIWQLFQLRLKLKLIFGIQLNCMTLIKILEFKFCKICLTAVISCFTAVWQLFKFRLKLKLKFGWPQLSQARLILIVVYETISPSSSALWWYGFQYSLLSYNMACYKAYYFKYVSCYVIHYVAQNISYSVSYLAILC